MGWGGRREGGSGWGIHVNPWLIHVNVWQKPLQYCKVISLQILKNKWKTNKLEREKQILYINVYIWNLEKWHYFGTKMVQSICRAGIETQT